MTCPDASRTPLPTLISARSAGRSWRLRAPAGVPCLFDRGLISFADDGGMLRVDLAPCGNADDRVRGKRSPLAGGEQQGPRWIIARWNFSPKGVEFAEKLWNAELHPAVVGLNASPGFVVVVDREHQPRRTGDNRVQKLFTRLESFTKELRVRFPRPHRSGVRPRP
jgi:hypothetical protein